MTINSTGKSKSENLFKLTKFSFTIIHKTSQFSSMCINLFLFLFTHMYIYDRHINKIKNAKTKMHKTSIRCKATVAPEIKLNEEQLQN